LSHRAAAIVPERPVDRDRLRRIGWTGSLAGLSIAFMFAAPLRSRFVSAPVRLAALALIVAGILPIPVVHSHEMADGSRSLALHVALFHSGRDGGDPRQVHMHLVPPSLFGGCGFAGCGPGGATGDENAPCPENDRTCPPELAAVDAPIAVEFALIGVTDALLPRPLGVMAPTHFLETYRTHSDLCGLLGVCRC
jgi:hypothetical protein